LWFWGGGTASRRRDIPLPRLFADDPLVSGYWRSAGAEPVAWPGCFAECVSAATGGFVAIPPRRPGGGEYLEELRVLASRGELGELTLLFDDGLRIDLERWHRLRFWRLDPPGGNDT
jgi:hypothetical protein